MPRRFPLRTIILMFLTLAAFVWYYWQVHGVLRRLEAQRTQVQQIEVVPMGGDR